MIREYHKTMTMRKTTAGLFFIVLFASFAVAALPLTGCRRREERRTTVRPTGVPGRFAVRFETMGTDAFIVVYAPDAARADSYVAPAIGAIENVDRLMSFYRQESDIGALNSSEAGTVVEVSGETYEVLKESIRMAEITGGAFDPTYTPLRDVWRRAQDEDTLPSEKHLGGALEKVGAEDIVMLGDNHVKFKTEGMLLDLGGIAKGYAVDLAIKELRRAGCSSALVDIGGDMAVLGRRGDKRKWRVEMRDPRGEVDEPYVLEVEDMAIATSGDYARYFTVGERRFSHIIDARTGWPADSIPSVTVTAPDALTADALATALSVLDVEEGMELIDSLAGVEGMIMERKAPAEEDDEEVVIHYSEGFRELLVP